MTVPSLLGALRRSGRAKVGTAVLVLALAGGGVVLAHPWRDDSTRATLTQSPVTAPTTEPSAEPTTEPTAAASATPTRSASVAASATSTPSTSSSPTGAGGGSDDELGPYPPGSVTVPHTPGQHTWSGTSNGMTIRASISPQQPHAGSPVTFTVHVSGPENDCCAVYIVFGDGGVSSQVDCSLPTTGGSATATYTHTYNKAGPHHMLIQAVSGKCQDNGELYGTIDIGAGTSTSQGPQLPVVKFSQSTPPANDPYYQKVSLWGEVNDDDGHVTKLVVSFGDGTSHTFAGDPNPCRPSRDGWPGPSTANLPYDPKPYEHAFAHSGTYTLRLTAYSAGCDGTQVQKASATFIFHAGPGPGESTPTPTPTPSPSPSPG